MIVTTGKIIRVETRGGFTFERNSETPGMVRVSSRRMNETMELPANDEEVQAFCEAYVRAAKEDVGYRKKENE